MNSTIRWFATNRVAANLLMTIILVGGIGGVMSVKTELFPLPDQRSVTVSITYDGAGTEDIVDNVLIPVEAAVSAIEGVKQVSSTATEGFGEIVISFRSTVKIDRAVNDVRTAVNGIQSFPSNIDVPKIAQSVETEEILSLAIYGPLNLVQLTDLGQRVKSQLLALPAVSATVLYVPKREISIEIRQEVLRRYGLSISAASEAVKAFSVDVPAGTLRTASGDVLLRTRARARTETELAGIPIIELPNGHKLLLSDIATITDGFTEAPFVYRFNGHPAVGIALSGSKSQDLVKAVAAIETYVEDLRQTLPEGINVQVWANMGVAYSQQISLLTRNGISGLILVFITLMLFLRTSLAFWVTAGIGVSILGAFWAMQTLDVTLSIVSSFGFLLVLGVMVDDAIVVGENIYTEQENGFAGLEGAIRGIESVSWPVAFGVATSVVSVSPVLFFQSSFGDFLKDISIVIIVTLGISLLECFWILPSHLAHSFREISAFKWVNTAVKRVQAFAQQGLENLKNNLYLPASKFCTRYPYLTCAGFIFLAIVSFSLVASGRVALQLEPNFMNNTITATVQFPDDAPNRQIQDSLSQLEASLTIARSKVTVQPGTLRNVHIAAYIIASTATVMVEFQTSDESSLPLDKIAEEWQFAFGDAPGKAFVRIKAGEAGSDSSIELAMRADDVPSLRHGLELMREELMQLASVVEVYDDADAGRPEISFERKPLAEQLGISLRDISLQVRQAFFGDRVDRLPSASKSVDVYVRLAGQQRREIEFVEDLPVRVNGGGNVPLAALATFEMRDTLSSIQRVGGSIVATAYIGIDTENVNKGQIVEMLRGEILPRIKQAVPGFSLQLSGSLQDEEEFGAEAIRLFLIAMLVIYALLAVGSNSYFKPLVILTAVPFGFVGAIYGHWLLGLPFTLFSAMGLLATAGVVINDNLVLVHKINKLKDDGVDSAQAVFEGCRTRFRPILLTSLTTCMGMLPILFETNLNAQILIPTALSLASGVFFCTFVTLLFVPALYAIFDDLRSVRSVSATSATLKAR